MSKAVNVGSIGMGNINFDVAIPIGHEDDALAVGRIGRIAVASTGLKTEANGEQSGQNVRHSAPVKNARGGQAMVTDGTPLCWKADGGCRL